MGLIRSHTGPQPERVRPGGPAIEALLRELDDPESDRRREAALGLEGVVEAVPAMLDRVPVETDPAVRDTLLTTLAAADTGPVGVALSRHLASPDAGLRTAVAGTLAVMPVGSAAAVPGLLADPDHGVRVMAVFVLARMRPSVAMSWLIGVIRDDPHANVVTAAIDALLPVATAEHIPLLTGAMCRFPDDPFLCFVVETTVSRLTGVSP